MVHPQTVVEHLQVPAQVRTVSVDDALRRSVHHGRADPLRSGPSGHHARDVVDPACTVRVVAVRTADGKDNVRTGRRIEDELRIH